VHVPKTTVNRHLATEFAKEQGCHPYYLLVECSRWTVPEESSIPVWVREKKGRGREGVQLCVGGVRVVPTVF